MCEALFWRLEFQPLPTTPYHSPQVLIFLEWPLHQGSGNSIKYPFKRYLILTTQLNLASWIPLSMFYSSKSVFNMPTAFSTFLSTKFIFFPFYNWLYLNFTSQVLILKKWFEFIQFFFFFSFYDRLHLIFTSHVLLLRNCF